MVGLNTEHVLIFVIVVFVLYMIGCRCSCNGNGFRVGGQGTSLSARRRATTQKTALGPSVTPSRVRFAENCCSPDGPDDSGNWFGGPAANRAAISQEVQQCIKYAVAKSSGLSDEDAEAERIKVYEGVTPIRENYTIAEYMSAAKKISNYCEALDY